MGSHGLSTRLGVLTDDEGFNSNTEIKTCILRRGAVIYRVSFRNSLKVRRGPAKRVKISGCDRLR